MLSLGFVLILCLGLRQVLYVPLAILALLIFLDRYIPVNAKNLLYMTALLSPFPTILSIFLFYLPFAFYGSVFKSAGFARNYLFGYTITFFSAALIYIISLLTDIRINSTFIFILYYVPLLVFTLICWKKHSKSIFDAFYVSPKELTFIMSSIFLVFFAISSIISNESMYASNGTYMYTKFLTVFEGLHEINEVPQYDPRIGQGEQLFLSDTPIFYSNLAFVNTILSFIPSVLFYNSMTAFIIWMSFLGAWFLILKILNSDDYFAYIASFIGACAIILSFTFLQIFESFKQSSAYPHDFLALSIIFSGLNPLSILFSSITLMVSFLLHPTKASGVILIAIFSVAFIMIKSGFWNSIKQSLAFFSRNKLKTTVLFLVLILIPVFYLFPGYFYKNYARGTEFHFSDIRPLPYVSGFFAEGNTPLSVSYPDLNRLDQKRFGFFMSFFGAAAVIFSLAMFRSNRMQNAAIFAAAYIAHFAFSSIMSQIPPFPQAEYGYRTVLPFLLVAFAACICASVCFFRKHSIRIVLIAVLIIGAFHAAYYAKQNLKNIHSESIISGKSFSNEIALINQIPNDGRFMSLGWYSNAVDMALSVQTDHYFSRYGYLQWDFSDNIYDKITTMNSFGVTETIEPMTSNEFSNYLRLAGYKYAFLNICHPVGNLALKKLYPDNSYPIYQNPSQQCIVLLGINNSNYAEKVELSSSVNESSYLNQDGYWHVTFNRNKKIHNFDLTSYNINSSRPLRPEPLQFRRNDFYNVEIYGDFGQGDWVVFKEEYFPRWKATMNGKEVPLLATNNRMMLIQTEQGSKIELQYDLHPEEKAAAFISLPAILAIFAILIFAI